MTTSKFKNSNSKFFKASIENAQLYLQNTVVEDYNELFTICCSKGYLDHAKLLLAEKTIDIHSTNDYPFRICCINGHLKMVEWFLTLQKQHGIINVDLDFLFSQACRGGHLEIAKLLLDGFKTYDIYSHNPLQRRCQEAN